MIKAKKNGNTVETMISGNVCDLGEEFLGVTKAIYQVLEEAREGDTEAMRSEKLLHMIVTEAVKMANSKSEQ